MAFKWAVTDKGYAQLKAEILKLKGRSVVYVGVQGTEGVAMHDEVHHPEETSLEDEGRYLGFRALATKLRRGKPVATIIEPVRESILVTRRTPQTRRRHTNAQVATWMEFGTPTIPARSFLRSTIERNARKYYAFIKTGLVAVLTGKLKHSDQLLALLGERCVADTRLSIRKGIPPPLSEARIKRKKSSKPLIDTGQLINSITYQVEQKP